MAWKTRILIQVALGCGLVLAGVGAAVLWSPPPRDSPRPVSTNLSHKVEGLPARMTHTDLETVHAEIERLKNSRGEWERHAAAMQSELIALRTQLTQIAREQKSVARSHNRGTEKSAEAPRGQLETPRRDATIVTPPPTPEEEAKQSDAHIQAQVELIETTMRVEKADPEWASTAEEALQNILQSEELGGLYLVEATCRTTLCRLELVLDSAGSPQESFHLLASRTPWHGQGFVRIEDGETPVVTMYLAREGYELPQVQQ